MRNIPLFHIGNLLILAAYCLLAASVFYWIAWLIYFIVFLGTLKRNIWWMRLAILPPLLIVLITVPFLASNSYALLLGSALYQDSPATIIVVCIFGLLTTLPSALVLGSYWIHRRTIFSGPLNKSTFA